VLRLPRAGRPTDSDRTRLEAALAAGSSCVLVPSAGEVDRLVDRGLPRQLLRILPEAVDRRRFPDSLTPAREEPGHRVALVSAEGAGDSELRRMLGRLPGCEAVAVQADPDDERRPELLRGVDVVVAAEDSGAEVSMVLQAMSSGLPAVALDTGVLSDLVADGVTGLLVPRVTDFPEALRSLVADPMRMQSMGLAAVDRVRARFDTAVVGPLLERLLLEVASDGEEQAAAS
jgi:glycosyltransferase involved in cell wall biosynthesis